MNAYHQSEWESGAPRRILGMKMWQFALLGGIAALDCLVLVVGAVVIIGSIPSSAAGGSSAKLPPTATPKAQIAGPTLAPSLSVTPLTMAFQFPTYTPYGTPAETETPTPTPTDPMAGWVKFFVKEVEIWMPGSFAAGRPQTEAKAIIASLKEKGADYNWPAIENDMTSAAPNYVLWGIDSYQGNPAIVTFVAVVYDFPNPGEPLADYATRFIGALSDDFVLIEQQKVRHPVYEVERVILETKGAEGTPMQVALYAARDQNMVWDVLCFTAADEMDERLRVFDQMVGTFRVLASPQ
jgi:hypothetical protein